MTTEPNQYDSRGSDCNMKRMDREQRQAPLRNEAQNGMSTNSTACVARNNEAGIVDSNPSHMLLAPSQEANWYEPMRVDPEPLRRNVLQTEACHSTRYTFSSDVVLVATSNPKQTNHGLTVPIQAQKQEKTIWKTTVSLTSNTIFTN